jgi:hypothetical protein
MANRRAALCRATVDRHRLVADRNAAGEEHRKVARIVADQLAVEGRRGLCL